MTERLPKPDVGRFPALVASDVRVLPAGTDAGRVYSAGGRHGTTWNRLRAFGPTRCRFDHQPPPAEVHPSRRIMYAAPAIAAPDGQVYPVLKTCLAECFRDSGAVDLTREDPYFAVFALTREVRMLDLGDSDWVTRAGGNGAISSGLRSRSREWSRAICRHYAPDALDGLIYPSSHIPFARSVALWESVESALPASPDLNEPLDHTGLRAAIETYAAALGLDLAI